MKNKWLSVDEFLKDPDICPHCGGDDDMEILETYNEGNGELQQTIKCHKCGVKFYIGYIINTYGKIN